jgi:hypothetical protein
MADEKSVHGEGPVTSRKKSMEGLTATQVDELRRAAVTRLRSEAFIHELVRKLNRAR